MITFICEWCKRSVEAQIYDETVNWVHSFSLDFETITGSNFVLNTSDAMMALWIGWLIGLSWESILGIKLTANDNCRSYNRSSRQSLVNEKTGVLFQAVPTAKDRAILVTEGVSQQMGQRLFRRKSVSCYLRRVMCDLAAIHTLY